MFGVCILGLTTAVGGGVIRDLILGNTPPATFQTPIYAAVALLTALVLFLPQVRHLLMHDQALYDSEHADFGLCGSGVFTVMGIRIAYAHVNRPTLFLLVFVGVLTGVGGGVHAGHHGREHPLHLCESASYASASLAGALLCTVLWQSAGQLPAMLAGMGTVILIRGLSAHFRWNLPKARE